MTTSERTELFALKYGTTTILDAGPEPTDPDAVGMWSAHFESTARVGLGQFDTILFSIHQLDKDQTLWIITLKLKNNPSPLTVHQIINNSLGLLYRQLDHINLGLSVTHLDSIWTFQAISKLAPALRC